MNSRAIAVRVLCSLKDNYYKYEEKIAENIRNSGLSQQNIDYIYIIVKGVIQQVRLIDYILSMAVNRPLKKVERIALNLLRVGVFQEIFLGTPSHASVNETVEASKDLKRADLAPFINAVLRHLPEEGVWRKRLEDFDQVERLSVEYSHPEWLIERWLNRFGQEETKKLLSFNNTYQKIMFRHNPLKSSWSDFVLKCEQHGFAPDLFRSRPIHFFSMGEPGSLIKSELFKDGECSVQDFSQALAVMLLNPKSGENILDVCAGPGGKTTFIAQLKGKEGEHTAVDIGKGKIELLKNECSRLGIDSVNYMVADAMSAKFTTFDKIIIDAPCSGTGVISRHADLRWNKKSEDLIKLAEIQLGILNNVSHFVDDRGVLLYCTCSLEEEENWGVVEKFLNSHVDFVIESAEKFVPKKYCDSYGAIRILPQKHRMNGSFAVRMVKVIL